MAFFFFLLLTTGITINAKTIATAHIPYTALLLPSLVLSFIFSTLSYTGDSTTILNLPVSSVSFPSLSSYATTTVDISPDEPVVDTAYVRISMLPLLPASILPITSAIRPVFYISSLMITLFISETLFRAFSTPVTATLLFSSDTPPRSRYIIIWSSPLYTSIYPI